MKEICLTKNQVAVIDDVDSDLVGMWSWHCNSQGYAARGTRLTTGSRKVSTILMHRTIGEVSLGLLDGQKIDHVDGNRLNNRRSNLRVATPLENSRNRRKHKTSAPIHSCFKGVHWNRKKAAWETRISNEPGKRMHLGFFECEIEAAFAYDRAALLYHGKFSRTNLLGYAKPKEESHEQEGREHAREEATTRAGRATEPERAAV